RTPTCHSERSEESRYARDTTAQILADQPTATIRRASPAEAAQLSALALRSKAHWGYDSAFLEACVVPLTVSPERINTTPVYVAEANQRVVGFYGLGQVGDDADLA